MTRAAGDPVVSGPQLVGEGRPQLGVEFGSLWRDVIRAGGPVSFRVDDPEEEIRAAAEAEIRDMRIGRQQLLVLDANDTLVGTVFLRRAVGRIFEHRAELHRLMVRPDLQGRGLGTMLLAAAVTHAVDIGLEQLLLAVRGGSRLPAFYRARGWTEVGVWPGALVIAPGEVRDQVWFQLRL